MNTTVDGVEYFSIGGYEIRWARSTCGLFVYVGLDRPGQNAIDADANRARAAEEAAWAAEEAAWAAGLDALDALGDRLARVRVRVRVPCRKARFALP